MPPNFQQTSWGHTPDKHVSSNKAKSNEFSLKERKRHGKMEWGGVTKSLDDELDQP